MGIYFILFFNIALINQSFAGNVPNFENIIKKNASTEGLCTHVENGLCFMLYSNGLNYCRSKGAHLPSAREFAQFAESHGAKGILEIDEVKKKYNGVPPMGYQFYHYKTPNSNNGTDEFYFNEDGYKTPSRIFAENTFLASSRVEFSTNPDWNMSNAFWGDTGQIGSALIKSAPGVIICVTDGSLTY